MWKNVKVDRWESQIEIHVPQSATVVESEARPAPVLGPNRKDKKRLKKSSGHGRIKAIVNKGSRVAIALDDPTKSLAKRFDDSFLLEELRPGGC